MVAVHSGAVPFLSFRFARWLETMAREKKRKGKTRKGTASDRHIEVAMVPTVEFLHRHVSGSLCEEVYRDLRTTERERKWSLFALARFWLAVIVEAPASLSQLLDRTRRQDPRGFLPQVEASAESFFEKAKNFSSGFFEALYGRFVSTVLDEAPTRYCQERAYLLEKFPGGIKVVDGSRLDKIAHRLKILWPEKAAILPGCILAVYDLYRGFATQLWFEVDAAASEFKRALLAMECMAPGSLVLGDRLYCGREIFHVLSQGGAFGLFRRTKTLTIKKKRRLSRALRNGGLLEDWLVEAGRGSGALELRLLRLKKNGTTYEALTNVLDPELLSVEDAVGLYPLRWTVERLFYDLKVVLNLKRFYAANPNAIAMQVYAAAMVHAAFRIAQADIARRHDLPPEELSPQKLFPLLALTSIRLLEAELIFEATQAANPRVKLKKPNWATLPGTIVSLRYLRVQRRSGPRRKREYDEERRQWKSITKVEGGEELT